MTFERILTYKGETLTVTEWSKRVGITNKTLFMRLKAGWSIEKTLEWPIHGNANLKRSKDISWEEKKKEQDLIRSYLKTQSSDVEESREEGDIL